MKKLFLTLGVAMMAMSSFAAQRILYQQNFETVTDVAATGWTYGGASMTIASDEFGKFLELSLGQQNGRSGILTWGNGIYLDEDGNSLLEDGTYVVSFDFMIKAPGNNQFNTDITVFTNHTPVNNQPYRTPWGPAGAWNNFIFDMYQTNTAAATDMSVVFNEAFEVTETTSEPDGDNNTTTTVTYSIPTLNEVTVATGTWYTATMTVDTESRTVEYTVDDVTLNNLTSGTWNVPENDYNGEPISMFAEGIFAMMARYQSVFDFDNIKVYFESENDFANEPTVVLKGVGKDLADNLNLNSRIYEISFMEGETLHVILPGTTDETEVDYADCDGAYVQEFTTSGTLTAWTTSGDATSEKVSVEVECVPCVLPAAKLTISSVEAGYGKTYTIDVSNADVPLQPTIFVDVEFDGAKLIENGANGAKFIVKKEGAITVTTKAFGYQQATAVINNDIEFAVKKDYDFARMDVATLEAAGFNNWQVLNSGTTSGFSNWTARRYLYYYDVNTATVDSETGETVYTAVYPFGFISEDNTTNVVNYAEIGADVNVAKYELFEGLNVYAGHNVSCIQHVGLYNNETGGGNNKNVDVLNLDKTDFVVINRIAGYGGNSNHPVVATVEEYYAQLAGDDEVYSVAASGVLNEDTGKYTLSMPVYRIDTACTRVTIYKQLGDGAGVDNVAVDEKESNDPYYYTIDGIRLAEPTHAGFYIHNGKKVFVK